MHGARPSRPTEAANPSEIQRRRGSARQGSAQFDSSPTLLVLVLMLVVVLTLVLVLMLVLVLVLVLMLVLVLALVLMMLLPLRPCPP